MASDFTVYAHEYDSGATNHRTHAYGRAEWLDHHVRDTPAGVNDAPADEQWTRLASQQFSGQTFTGDTELVVMDIYGYFVNDDDAWSKTIGDFPHGGPQRVYATLDTDATTEKAYAFTSVSTPDRQRLHAKHGRGGHLYCPKAVPTLYRGGGDPTDGDRMRVDRDIARPAGTPRHQCDPDDYDWTAAVDDANARASDITNRDPVGNALDELKALLDKKRAVEICDMAQDDWKHYHGTAADNKQLAAMLDTAHFAASVAMDGDDDAAGGSDGQTVTLLFPTEGERRTYENVVDVETEWGKENRISMTTAGGRELTRKGQGVTIESIK